MVEDPESGGHPGSATGWTINEQELLSGVYQDPTNDGPRHVYADWLAEKGDPRGELIALQLNPDWESDPKGRRRVKELLKAHEADWLGDIAPVITAKREFRRGFLAKATMKWTCEDDVKTFGALPEWATIEELGVAEHVVKRDKEPWARWIGPAMRHVKVLSGPLGCHLLTGDTVWKRLEHFTTVIHRISQEEYREILSSPRLPALRKVQLQGGAHHKWLDEITTCPPELVFDKKLAAGDRQDWLKKAEKTQAERLVFVDGDHYTHTFSRDDGGGFSRLHTAIVPPNRLKSIEPIPPVLSDYIQALASFQRWSLTAFDATIQLGKQTVPALPAIQAVAEAKLVRPKG